MNQQKQKRHQPSLDRALAIASGPVQFLASDGRPLDEGRWTDPFAMLQHAADVKAATISVPTPQGAPIRFDTSGLPAHESVSLSSPARETKDLAGKETGKMAENGTIQIGQVEVKIRRWTKHGKDRLYFSAGRRGQACWDLKAGEWIKQHGEFGGRFKAQILARMGL